MSGCMQKRFILAGMGFWCFFVLSALRLNFGLAIVAMVNWTFVQADQNINTSSKDSCHFDDTKDIGPKKEDGPFEWETSLQGYILGSYFYGLASTQLLGGRLSELMSAKKVLLIGTMVATLSTLLVPISAAKNGLAVVVLQVCKGMGQGIMMPAFNVLMGNWIPPVERTRFMSCIASGMPVGGFLTVILSGYICGTPSLGWRYVFYIFGAIGAAWCLFWALLIHDSPLTHPRITRRELNRIMSLRSQKAPRLNGTMSAIPNLVEAFFLISTSLVSDYLLKRKILCPTTIRKTAISTGLLGYALCMIIVTFTGCKRTLSVFFLVLALGMSGFNFASTAVVPVDMSPRFAGTISGIMNTFGALSGVIIPSVIGFLTRHRQTMDEWSIIFYVSAAICLLAVIVFIAFGSSEIQVWNSPPPDPISELERAELDDSSPTEDLSGPPGERRRSSRKDEEAPGPSGGSTGAESQRALVSIEHKKKGKHTESRPWRTDSFPDTDDSHSPAIVLRIA